MTTTTDTIVNIGKSTIQHGKYNDRIYLMHCDPDDIDKTIEKLDQLSRENDYSKIFAKVPRKGLEPFENAGYQVEARIPTYFEGKSPVFFMARYRKEWRKEPNELQHINDVLDNAKKVVPPKTIPEPAAEYPVSVCTPEEAEEMAQVYGVVFKSYPFPIYDPAYIRKTIEENVVYFAVRYEGKIVALSSAEMDEHARAAEMTDFATLPAFRGKGLATILLGLMEDEMKRRDVPTVYTIARAMSFGMNAVFAKHGYTFDGTLINNTNISGNIESMNVWWKKLL
ncbi:MAG: putative beta-lysine N-acetyltransferase [Chitinivibrionales bacterium]